ncbi:MAG: NAD-dependent epimerase/dehydratase family protein [Streptosporangiaceae bacterium]
MSVLVTGGCGFVGTHVAHALTARGDDVVLFDAAVPEPELVARRFGPRATVVAGDITEPACLPEVMRRHAVTSVVHAAAIVGVAASARSPAHAVRVNVDGALDVFEAGVEAGVRRVVDLSSEEVYGHFPRDPVTEDSPREPISPYGISKLAVEQLGGHYADHRGLDYVAVRLSWVYGPGFPRRRLPHPWLEDIAAGRNSRLPRGGDQRIDFTYVSEAVRGILAIHDAPRLTHRSYNIASGTGTSIRRLADLLREQRPTWEACVGDGPLELAPGVEAARKGALSIERAREELGYQPMVSLADGLERTLRSLVAGPERADAR